MRIAVASRHLPQPRGTAAGRVLLATCRGLIAEGHDVSVLSWGHDAPGADLPGWCEWRPAPRRPPSVEHLAAIVRPRMASARVPLDPPADAVAVADDPLSFGAIAAHSRRAATVHYATVLDAGALRRVHPSDLQDVRAERRSARRSHVTLTYSTRVATAIRTVAPSADVRVVPVAWEVPERPLAPVEDPTVVLVADWSWPPNRVAAHRLLGCWPSVVTRVRGARLVLAGRGDLPVGTASRVEVRGAVADPLDVLADAAVVAFPCPPTSGPKIKVLEAVSCGIPVVTTPSGVEGLAVPEGSVTLADESSFGAALVAVLGDPEGRNRGAERARRAIQRVHAPQAAARARVSALRDVTG